MFRRICGYTIDTLLYDKYLPVTISKINTLQFLKYIIS